MMKVFGGDLKPAKVGKGYGARWTMNFSNGGSASSRADGIAQKGKTKGKMVAMCCGGMPKGKK